jgi:hypothetical protein
MDSLHAPAMKKGTKLRLQLIIGLLMMKPSQRLGKMRSNRKQSLSSRLSLLEHRSRVQRRDDVKYQLDELVRFESNDYDYDEQCPSSLGVDLDSGFKLPYYRIES